MSKKLFFTLLSAGFIFISAHSVNAVYLASDLLGQLDGDTPNFGVAGANNRAGAGSPNNKGFNNPTGGVLDTKNHRIFISDTFNNRVLVFNMDFNNNLLDRTADYVLGQPDFSTSSSGLSSSTFNFPATLTYSTSSDYLFVGDALNRRILVFDLSGGITNGMPASYVIGQTDFDSNGSGTTSSTFSLPTGGLYDPINNRLFIGDQGNNRVLIFDLSGGITNGMPASYVIGQPDFTSNTATATISGLQNPTQVAYDSANEKLFIADMNNSRVIVHNIATITNGMDAVAVIGQSDFTSNASSTTQTGLGPASGVSYDSVYGRLYVSSALTGGPGDNNRITIYDVNTLATTSEPAVAVLCQDNFVSEVEDVGQGNCSSAAAIVYDSANNRLYVSDQDNHRVLIYNFVTFTTTSSLPAGTQGTAYSQALNTTSSQGTTTLSISSGALPSGLSIGSITGTPTQSGSFTFTVLATDDNGAIGTFVGSQEFTLTISASSGGGDQQQQSSTGGTVDIASLLPFQPPIYGLKLLINNGSPTTNSRYVTLTLEGGSDAKKVKLATLPDFSNSLGQEPYSVSVPFDLCLNQTACPAKNYTVYVTFYTQGGQPSQVISDSIALTSSQAVVPSQREVIQAQIRALQLQVVQLLQQLLQILRGGR